LKRGAALALAEARGPVAPFAHFSPNEIRWAIASHRLPGQPSLRSLRRSVETAINGLTIIDLQCSRSEHSAEQLEFKLA
jgi:hypothetical protein